ncbi:MAG: Holliday junction resolvase RuvX [Muribaculum sp.]|nr:Holliday junction resolvase RuvX [Muribaculaceae bacterium]MCM1081745.1 Holliday junction resolvase RuvX [Muribaculum sp.]
MGRLLSIDYGRRRCGIAVTDTCRIVATGLATVATGQLQQFILKYISEEPVDEIIVGLPTTLHGELSESMRYIRPGIDALRRVLPPEIPVVFFDERFTSTLAHKAMLDGGMRRSRRQDKAIVDEMAATIILNDYIQSKAYNK